MPAFVTRVPACHLFECRGEPHVIEDVGMEVEDLLTQLADRRVDSSVNTLEALGFQGALSASQVVARGDEVLYRGVVEGAGQARALPLDRLPGRGDQALSALGELLCLRSAPPKG